MLTMRTGRRARSRVPSHGRVRDRGTAIPLMALMIMVLVAAVTVAVDLGSRYAEAAKIQRAADAAALAAVTVLPQGFDAAQAEARQVAARNGYTHGVDDITVSVVRVSAEVVQVTIQDSAVPEFFADAFDGTATIARSATAEYIRAVELGSPRNFLGTGYLLGCSNTSGAVDQCPGSAADMRQIVGRNVSQTAALRENYWLAVSGQCASKENGDRFTAITDANYGNSQNPRPLDHNGSPYSCTGGNTITNTEQRNYGYIYGVTVPPGYTRGNIDIQVLDPAHCVGGAPGDDSGGFSTRYTVRTGSIDPLSGTVVSTGGTPASYGATSSGCNTWTTLASVNPGTAGGTYFVQVNPVADANTFHRSNGFALRANVTGQNTAGRFWACSSDSKESLYVADCPQVYAVGDMGVYAALSGTQAEFFLAEVGPEYNGKRLDITLFDPGEGAEALQIRNPAGQLQSFTWEVDCPAGVTAPTGGCSGGPTTSLDLIGNSISSSNSQCTQSRRDVDTNDDGTGDRCASNPQPGGYRGSRWKFNDRSLTIKVQLPQNILSAYNGNLWWKVVYTTNTFPTDRTTWSVVVQGDPVRLIPNP